MSFSKDTLIHTELPLPGQPLSLTAENLITIKEGAYGSGLFYVVPPHKLHLHEGRKTRSLPVTPELENVFGEFKDPATGNVTLDVEDVHHEVLAGADLGLTTPHVNKIRAGIRNHFKLARQFAQSHQGLVWLTENLSQSDYRRLELNQLRSSKLETRSPIDEGTLVRVDILKRQDGELVSCDPNLLPLGMAHNYTFATEVERETGNRILQSNRYVQEIARLADNHPGLAGYLTSLAYGNWSSHMRMAQAITETTGKSFHIIPTYCFTPEGLVDTDQLRDFYKAMGLNQIIPISHTGLIAPSCIVRYAREATHFDTQTKVINYPGTRITESQIWGALAVLPGIEAWMQWNKIHANLNLIADITVPSILARMGSNGLEVAKSVLPNFIYDGLHLKWGLASENIPMFEAAMTSICSQEKNGERAWYIKSPATSGKKGVRFTNDGNIGKAPALVEKLLKNDPVEGIFIIQPKIRSTHLVDDRERRLKINLFLTGEDLEFTGADCMLAPINQRATHGGSETVTCLIKV